MKAIQSQQGEGSNHKDPYGDVIKKPEHSGRVRTFGKGVTNTVLKNGGKSSSYIFPEAYLQIMQSQVMDQVLQANPDLQKLLEANPGVKIVLPSMSRSGSNGNPLYIESNEHNSTGAQSNNYLVSLCFCFCASFLYSLCFSLFTLFLPSYSSIILCLISFFHLGYS